MKIERQKAMVKSVAKAMNQKDRQQAKYFKLRDKIVKICNKYNTDIESLDKSEMTDLEIKDIQNFYINQAGLTVAHIVFKKWF